VNDFEEKRYRDPRALALMKKITLRSDPALPNADLGAKMQVMSREGQIYNARIPIPPGSMLNPADDGSLVKKFVTLAEGALGRARTQPAIDAVLSVERMPDLGNLLNAITPSKQG